MSKTHLHNRWDDLKQRLQQSTLATQAASCRDRQRRNEIFRQRAVRLAAPVKQEDSRRETTQILVFVLDNQQFGIPLSHVVQVYPGRPLTPVPNTPMWLLGIGNFEARIRSVIDLAELLDLSDDRSGTGRNILLVRNAIGVIALQVDRVEEVRNIDLDQLFAPELPADSVRTPFIRGMTPEHLVILSVDVLITRAASSCG